MKGDTRKCPRQVSKRKMTAAYFSHAHVGSFSAGANVFGAFVPVPYCINRDASRARRLVIFLIMFTTRKTFRCHRRKQGRRQLQGYQEVLERENAAAAANGMSVYCVGFCGATVEVRKICRRTLTPVNKPSITNS